MEKTKRKIGLVDFIKDKDRTRQSGLIWMAMETLKTSINITQDSLKLLNIRGRLPQSDKDNINSVNGEFLNSLIKEYNKACALIGVKSKYSVVDKTDK